MHKIAEQKFSPSIFKAYDIRGVYPDEINENAAYKIARAFVDYIKLSKRDGKVTIAISADARASSPALKEAFIRGLMDEDANIIDAGLTTTPMHYFVINKTEADGGAMITASHNPAQFNGLKLSKKGAVPIGEGAGREEIKNVALRGIFRSEIDANLGEIRNQDFLDEYINFFENKFPQLKDCSLKIVADASNGMASILLRKLFSKFSKLQVEFLHSDLDMTFPNHEANPLNYENLQDVQKEVLKKQCALGISFDGDGDRVGFVDEKGEVVGGDLITALLAQGLEEKGSAVIYDLRSSRVVREEIERLGMRPVESRVGHTFLKANMRKENAVMGGEVSGHYYFRDFFFADSAIFATLSVLDMLCRENEKFSEIVKPLRKYAHSGEINFDVSDKDKILDRVVAHFADAKISYLDGIKVEYWDSANLKESWWFSLRPSNTENLLRLNLEASSPELLAQKKKLLEELLTT